MKTTIRLSAIISLLFIVMGFTASVQAQNPRVTAEAQRFSGDRFTVTTRTRRGANVYAVSRPSAGMLNAIDKGLTDLFAVARKNGYSRLLNYSEYTIYIGRPDRSKDSTGRYSPDIAIGTEQYAGSVYDQGGFMYVAGVIVANTPASFLIGDHTRDFERAANVVRYEGEHLVLYHNDRRRYNATRDHTQGGSHPILQ